MDVRCATLEASSRRLTFYFRRNSLIPTKFSHSFHLKCFVHFLRDAISFQLLAIDISVTSIVERPLCVWNLSKILEDSDLGNCSDLTNATVGYNTREKKCFFRLYRNNILEESRFKIVKNNCEVVLNISLYIRHVVQHGFLLDSAKLRKGCLLIFFRSGISEIEP